jgi:hypothetical protein
MLVEILKVVLLFLGGGLVGALLTEWFRRRGSRLQVIPLIERVNRLVEPKLQGFTLARLTGDVAHPLEQVRSLREYQLALHNTSSVHLQDVEIQFDFPITDVEGWASRPALSRTPPVPLEVAPPEPWKHSFRWRIPQLPSTDWIEFNFKAVNPPSENYEASLYGADRVVIEKSKGEPYEGAAWNGKQRLLSTALLASLGLAATLGAALGILSPHEGGHSTTFAGDGCSITVMSSYSRLSESDQIAWPWSPGPWQVSDRLVNVGSETCVIESAQFAPSPKPVPPGNDLIQIVYTIARPRLAPRQMLYGKTRPTKLATIDVFSEPEKR